MSKVKVAKDVHWSIAKNGDLADLKYIVIIIFQQMLQDSFGLKYNDFPEVEIPLQGCWED